MNVNMQTIPICICLSKPPIQSLSNIAARVRVVFSVTNAEQIDESSVAEVAVCRTAMDHEGYQRAVHCYCSRSDL